MLARLVCLIASFITLAAWRPDAAAWLLPPPLSVTAPPQTPQSAPDVRLPLQEKSIRFAVVGDTGTGDQAEVEVAQELDLYRRRVGFDFVIMLGDNISGGHKPQDFVQKFEQPFK